MKRVAILGNAQRTRGYAPFEDPGIDIWAMTIHALQAKRCDAVLEMHPDVLDGARWESFAECAAYRAWLRETATPVWMHAVDARIPASQAYPTELIAEKYLGGMRRGGERIEAFFGGTASYGVALALFFGYERIELYGIELNSRPAYDDERDCLFYWVGRANELGVDVTVHAESQLFRPILYPWEMR